MILCRFIIWSYLPSFGRYYCDVVIPSRQHRLSYVTSRIMMSVSQYNHDITMKGGNSILWKDGIVTVEMTLLRHQLAVLSSEFTPLSKCINLSLLLHLNQWWKDLNVVIKTKNVNIRIELYSFLHLWGYNIQLLTYQVHILWCAPDKFRMLITNIVYWEWYSDHSCVFIKILSIDSGLVRLITCMS